MRSSIKPKSVNRKLLLGVFASLVVFGTIWWLIGKPVNYADEVAKPLEEALIKSGSTKISSSGDAGYGIGNTQPYYDSHFEVPGNRNDAVAIVTKVAEAHGYRLTHATPENRGHLGAVSDTYIENWYFDTAEKASPYAKLETGVIRLAFQFGDDNNPDPEGYTKVRINVSLPSVKR